MDGEGTSFARFTHEVYGGVVCFQYLPDIIEADSKTLGIVLVPGGDPVVFLKDAFAFASMDANSLVDNVHDDTGGFPPDGDLNFYLVVGIFVGIDQQVHHDMHQFAVIAPDEVFLLSILAPDVTTFLFNQEINRSNGFLHDLAQIHLLEAVYQVVLFDGSELEDVV